jgi:hypothetical protein
MTVETFLNRKQEEQECKQNKRMTASLTDTSVKNAGTSSRTEGSEQKREELGLKIRNSSCQISRENFKNHKAKIKKKSRKTDKEGPEDTFCL